MFSNVMSASICGITGSPIWVEADVSDGLPMFSMVGDLSSQVREAQDRVKTALKNSGISLKPKKITVNLSPADVRKEGTAFDLPIAAAVLAGYGILKKEQLEGILIAGELGLNGAVKGIPGIMPMVREAAGWGCHTCLIPKVNEKEGAVIEGIRIVGVQSLQEALRYIQAKEEERKAWAAEGRGIRGALRFQPGTGEDFSDINGQEGVKRAAEVAVAGFHNFLMIGPPGSGKSMIAKRLPGILPDLTLEESLEISSIYSVAGLLGEQEPLIARRPFRAPHHTVSSQALAGGGRIPKPGEVSLAHGGVLFLDEMAEFQKPALEILRQPMEDKKICISRTGGSYVFPANFMLAAAMNPCKCGYYPDMNKCTCTDREVRQYLHKISQPLLDRIDVSVEAPAVEYADLRERRNNESSASIRKRITAAQNIQRKRYENTPFRFNGDLNVEGIREYCPLGREEEQLLERAYEKLNLSARAYHRLIKVARTIADLEGEERISCIHLQEAVCYRNVDKKFWL